MKIILGTVILAASHVINVHAFVIPSLSAKSSDASSYGPLDGASAGVESSAEVDKRSRFGGFPMLARRAIWDRFVARSPQVGTMGAPVPSGTDTINLETVTGTGPASTADSDPTTSTFENLSTMTPAPTGLAVGTPAATEAEGILTVTQTSIVFVTATVQPVSSSVPDVQNAAFGGTVGEANASSAPTGGAVITVNNGNDAFGGVVSSIIVSSTDSLTSTSTTLDTSTPTPSDSDGSAFGGVTGLVTLVESTATAPAGYKKRDVINTKGDILDNKGGSLVSFTFELNNSSTTTSIPVVTSSSVTSDSAADSVVIVTSTTTINPTVTVTQSGNAMNTTVNSGPGTATAVVTATLTVQTTTPTSLPNITLAQIFPNCANLTTNVTILQDITIPDMILPSNLTLSQLLGFFGGTANCSDLLTLLGVGNTGSGLTRRNLFKAKRMLRR